MAKVNKIVVLDDPTGSFAVEVTVGSNSDILLVTVLTAECIVEAVSSVGPVSLLLWGDVGRGADGICPWDLDVDVLLPDELLSSSVEVWPFVRWVTTELVDGQERFLLSREPFVEGESVATTQTKTLPTKSRTAMKTKTLACCPIHFSKVRIHSA